MNENENVNRRLRQEYIARLRAQNQRSPVAKLSVFLVLAGAVLGITLWLPRLLEKPSAAVAQAVPQPALPPAVLAELRERRKERLPDLHAGALVDAANGTDFAETPGYRKLLTTFLDHAPAEVTAGVAPYLDHQLALSAPEILQGERVRVRGVLCDSWAHRLEKPLWGRQDVYRGFLAAADGSDWVAFDVLEAPANVQAARDPIEVEGIFYRTVTYEAKVAGPDGKTTKTVPYVLGRAVVPLASDLTPSEVVRSNSVIFFVVLGLGVAWFGFRVLQLVLSRRRRKSAPNPVGFRTMFASRLKAASPPPEAPRGD